MKNFLHLSNFVFDSRKVKPGSTFVALSTGLKDGGNFAQNAIQNGASFLILYKKPHFSIEQGRYIVVENTLEFITKLAKEKFLEFKKQNVKTVAITGSAGKTTTKDLIKFLLQKAGKKVFATEGNYNNHIGLPLTILNAPLNIEFLILEMGMNNLEEISHLISIAPTDIRIITNIFHAHVGNFNNGIEGIFQAKIEILKNSNENTIFITDSKLLYLERVKLNFKGKTITIPNLLNYKIQNNQTSFDAFKKSWTINKKVTPSWLSLVLISLQVINFYGIKVNDISDFAIPQGRGEILPLSKNCILIDESYNASPESVKNAIETLNLYERKKCLILGEMKELGKYSACEHKKLIHFARSYQNITTFFIGESFKDAKYNWFLNIEDFIEKSKFTHLNYNVILIKASNSANFKQLIQEFLNKKIS